MKSPWSINNLEEDPDARKKESMANIYGATGNHRETPPCASEGHEEQAQGERHELDKGESERQAGVPSKLNTLAAGSTGLVGSGGQQISQEQQTDVAGSQKKEQDTGQGSNPVDGASSEANVDAEELQGKLKDARAELEEQNKAISALRSEIDGLKRENHALADEKQQLNGALQKEQHKVEDLKKKLTIEEESWKKARDALLQGITQLAEEQGEKFKKQVDAKQAEILNLVGQVENARQEGKNAVIAREQELVAMHQGEISKLNQQMLRIQADHDALAGADHLMKMWPAQFLESQVSGLRLDVEPNITSNPPGPADQSLYGAIVQLCANMKTRRLNTADLVGAVSCAFYAWTEQDPQRLKWAEELALWCEGLLHEERLKVLVVRQNEPFSDAKHAIVGTGRSHVVKSVHSFLFQHVDGRVFRKAEVGL